MSEREAMVEQVVKLIEADQAADVEPQRRQGTGTRIALWETRKGVRLRLMEAVRKLPR